MKILHISNDYFFSGLYSELQRSLLDAGCDSYFFVPVDYNSTVSSQDERVIPTHCYHALDKLFFRNKQREIYKRFRKVLLRIEPQLLHSHFLFSGGYSCLKAKKEFGIPYVVAVRNTDINVFFKHCFWLRPLGLSIMKEASAVIFIGDSYRQQVINQYVPQRDRQSILKKSAVIPNGIKSLWFQAEQQEKHMIAKHISIVYTGGIVKNKNLTATAEACELLISNGYMVSYTAIGKVLDNNVLSLLKQKSFFEHIPPKTAEQLMEIYTSQDIFVMPSIYETFGLVYAEAMSQGLPVIYTRGQGFDKQFDEGLVGYSVDPYNPNEIAEKIIDIEKDYKRISSACKQLVHKFDWNAISKEYMDIYSRCLQSE